MKKEKTILVIVNEKNALSESEVEYQILELKELVRASEAEVDSVVVQNLDKINPRYFIGSGKVVEIKEIAELHEVDTIIFNHELTGSQMKNLEDVIDKKIVDRTDLILNIFANRAKTSEAKLQVKLAQLEYRLPRLVGFNKHLSREGAGIGTRGPGEQKLETDRRTINREIISIKNKLKDEKLRRNIKRNKRNNSNIPIISIIGYSNSGKSTILNNISNKYSINDKKVYADNLLFATLNTSTRNIELDNGQNIIFSDTVGFVSNLPTKLVESFKSTLEEIEDSDLLMIVSDASNEKYDFQLKATQDVLKEMNLENKKILYVFNKMDLNPDFVDYNNFENEIYISAKNPLDISRLLCKIEEILFSSYDYYKAYIPYSEYEKYKSLVPKNKKNSEKYLDKGIETYLFLSRDNYEKYQKYLIKEVKKDE